MRFLRTVILLWNDGLRAEEVLSVFQFVSTFLRRWVNVWSRSWFGLNALEWWMTKFCKKNATGMASDDGLHLLNWKFV